MGFDGDGASAEICPSGCQLSTVSVDNPVDNFRLNRGKLRPTLLVEQWRFCNQPPRVRFAPSQYLAIQSLNKSSSIALAVRFQRCAARMSAGW